MANQWTTTACIFKTRLVIREIQRRRERQKQNLFLCLFYSLTIVKKHETTVQCTTVRLFIDLSGLFASHVPRLIVSRRAANEVTPAKAHYVRSQTNDDIPLTSICSTTRCTTSCRPATSPLATGRRVEAEDKSAAAAARMSTRCTETSRAPGSVLFSGRKQT